VARSVWIRISYQGQMLFIDPFVSRFPLSAVIRRLPTLPDRTQVGRYFGSPPSVVGVLVGHTHWDHAVDAPAVVARTGARAFGSASLANLLRVHGRSIGERAIVVEPFEVHDLGPFRVTFVPSLHSKILLGLQVPFRGDIDCAALGCLTPAAYRVGQVWAFHVEVAGLRIYHQGSADLIDDAVPGGGVDLFLAGIAGREFTPWYWDRILSRIRPAAVVPCHFDDFFRRLDEPMRFTADVRLASLPEEVEAVDRDARVVALPLLTPVGVTR